MPNLTFRGQIVIVGLMSLFSSAFADVPSRSEFLGNDRMPYAAFDRLPHIPITVENATLQLGFAPGDLSLSQDQVRTWVAHSATVVAHYYGRFPVNAVRILIVPVDGRGVRGGTTWAYRGAAIRLALGSQATEGDLKSDWTIVHEMVHLALPDMDERHRWLSEGLATYVEPIARVQSGDLTAESIWADMARDMPKGLPQSGDRGLNNTPTWARTYWGGALFCLVAEVEIRKETSNRFGLRDAMRGVLAAGGNHEVDWPVDRIFAAADKATGTHVMTTLYTQMGEKPFAPDLEKLWRDLGVVRQSDGNVVFDDSAPLASLRKTITMQSSSVSASR